MYWGRQGMNNETSPLQWWFRKIQGVLYHPVTTVFYNTSNQRGNQVFDYWLREIWLKSGMTWLPSWNTREGCSYNQNDIYHTRAMFCDTSHTAQTELILFITPALDYLVQLWNHFHFRPSKHCENLKTGVLDIEWSCTTNHSARSTR